MNIALKASPAAKTRKAARLKIARRNAGHKSAEAAAAAMGVSKHSYLKHEVAARSISDEKAIEYAAFFGVSAVWLITGAGDMIANPDYRVETADNDALREAYLEDNFGTSHRGDAKPSHVHASDAREDDWITQQELHMQTVADNSGSMIEDAIELHAALVAEDDKLYTADGKPLADKATLDASWRREVKAFRILARMRCQTPDDAQTKLRYFLRPAASDEYSNMERLVLDAYVDEHAKGSGIFDLTADFLQSLLVERV